MEMLGNDNWMYDFNRKERDVTPEQERIESKPELSDEDWQKGLPKLQEAIQAGRKTAETIITTMSSKYTLTD
ncbi:hypothetical protein R0J91_22685, partial [Micrococcus sp. SIMBA_131]